LVLNVNPSSAAPINQTSINASDNSLGTVGVATMKYNVTTISIPKKRTITYITTVTTQVTGKTSNTNS